jgi:hypothetical protein
MSLSIDINLTLDKTAGETYQISSDSIKNLTPG